MSHEYKPKTSFYSGGAETPRKAEAPRKGVVDFHCFTNTANNSKETKSVSYQILQDRITDAVGYYLLETHETKLDVRFSVGCPIGGESARQEKRGKGELEEDREKRISQYVARSSQYTFERLILPQAKIAELRHAANLFKHQDLIFNQWGLRQNGPFTTVALNFYGASGSGKTLAAQAVADYLGKSIIIASYGQIESMYHGEGPKNVEAIFEAAERQNAVLFIDEADSLLSARIANPQQGSENAINSMRSQILICLEKFNGIVIFATNLIGNYDQAMKTRIRSIEFELPDEECRRRIWEIHLPKAFPKDETASPEALAKIDGISGRDIKHAVQQAAEEMADENIPVCSYGLLSSAIERIKKANASDSKADSKTIKLNEEEGKALAEALEEAGVSCDDGGDEGTKR